jgi:transposase
LLGDVRALLARVELAEQNAQWVALMEGMLQNKESILESKESLIAFKESIIKSADIKSADIKIAALMLELAYHRRIRFACKSEALSVDQRDLFEETWDINLAAMQAELDAQGDALAQGKPKAKRRRAGHQPLPAYLVRIEHHHEPDSCLCGQCYWVKWHPCSKLWRFTQSPWGAGIRLFLSHSNAMLRCPILE